MRRPEHNTTALPRRLREELGASETARSFQRKQTTPGLRKERRRAARTENNSRGPSNTPIRSQGHSTSTPPITLSPRPFREPAQQVQPKSQGEGSHLKTKSQTQTKIQRPQPKSNSTDTEEFSSSSSPPPAPKVSRGFQDRLAADDAEIAALEKALGVKGRKKLPKAFEDEGLDVLLDGLGDDQDDNGVHKKRKRDEGEERLAAKRKKARKVNRQVDMDEVASLGDGEGSDISFDGFSNEGTDFEDKQSSVDSGSDEDSEKPTSMAGHAKGPIRENPYRAPTTSAVAAPKYVPPSLRNQVSSETEDISRLRRQIQGLINRLSEANTISILGDIESLYQSNARQHVSETLLDLLLGLLCDPAVLQDTFVILHASFITALYKTVGSDFGAQVIQRVDEEFLEYYDKAPDDARKGKKLTNLMSLVSQLYTFQMIGSNLIYDYIKMFASDLSEETAELLLKCVRSSGPQLRHDDPSALKEIVMVIQKAVSRIGENNLSVRTKFMIETIINLKNNRMRTGLAGSGLMSEHVVRMKKTLGSLNNRTIKATEPLRVGLRDIRESDKRGKWWLVGASYKGQDTEAQKALAPLQGNSLQEYNDSCLVQDGAGDMLQVAREQRMNTDVRRSIFVTIVSATDYSDASQRLMKLRLKKSQKLEIPKVIIHCAGVEGSYNPYYTLLAHRVCSDRNLRMAFQFSLWDLFKRMGEGRDKDQDEAEEENEKLSMRSIVNLAKMFGTLIAEGGLSMTVLKVLNLPYMQPKSRTFVELLIITIILRSQKDNNTGSRDKESVARIFVQAIDKPELAKGLQFFLKKTVSKTDIAGNQADKEMVKWGCKVARDVLKATDIARAVEE
ncbi:MAG: hypothetical protein LQ343_001472 [Gyalolechia ehrenbergii]|nr:MAG: hypothetical protein LQ343_001472 [Gyalolechia ehrenbergii]